MYIWEFIPNPPFTLGPTADSEQAALKWEHLREKLPLGTELSGPIFARTHFGVFYDAGVDFPVRINITDFGRPEDGMVFPDDYPALTSVMRGEISGFEDIGEGRRQIVTVRSYKTWSE